MHTCTRACIHTAHTYVHTGTHRCTHVHAELYSVLLKTTGCRHSPGSESSCGPACLVDDESSWLSFDAGCMASGKPPL
jgi:hypothetical protein